MNRDNQSQSDQNTSLGNQRALRAILIGCGIVLLSALIFTLGSGVGFAVGRMTADGAGSNVERVSPETTGAGASPERRQLTPADMDIFWEAMGLLEQDFYGPLPDERQRSYGAIRGVLDLLDDPNTSFLTPEEAQSFLDSMEGSFEGIGATVEWDEEHGAVRIVEPFENQPAWNAGLRRGDLVLAVDGQDVTDMANLTEAIAKIKGPEGTSVTLTVQRPGQEETFEVEIVRDVIQIPVVFTDTYGTDDDIAYIRLSRFSDRSGRLMRQAIDDALGQDPRGLIFDLRGNPGGLLREAVKISSIFLDDQPVLIERFSDGSQEVYRSESNPAVPQELPVVLLVDQGSASASEIVSGALQDAGRAVLVGTTTFGKGSVQLPHSLSDGSLMRVTIAKWYTPADRSIDGTGLEPDIVVEIDPETLGPDEDPQLDRAIELLQSGQ